MEEEKKKKESNSIVSFILLMSAALPIAPFICEHCFKEAVRGLNGKGVLKNESIIEKEITKR